MNDVMLDLETMGTSPRAAIIAIGAVAFDLETGELGDTFYSVVDLNSSIEAGGIVDASTILWWMGQSEAARLAILNPDSPGGWLLRNALGRFNVWMGQFEYKSVKLWGNGAGFDNVILRSAYEMTKTHVPWMHYNDRCYRTAKALLPTVRVEREGVHHNALDDAVYQAKVLIEAEKIRVRRDESCGF